jgi:hypothetical protein
MLNVLSVISVSISSLSPSHSLHPPPYLCLPRRLRVCISLSHHLLLISFRVSVFLPISIKAKTTRKWIVEYVLFNLLLQLFSDCAEFRDGGPLNDKKDCDAATLSNTQPLPYSRPIIHGINLNCVVLFGKLFLIYCILYLHTVYCESPELEQPHN